MSKTVTVNIKRLLHLQDLPLPSYASAGSAGMDMLAAIEHDIVLKPFERKAIPTGICIELPEGYEAQIRPRSGLALKNGLSAPNSPGTIDSDYRGEVCVILINLSPQEIVISRGMKIAQMIIAEYSQATWQVVEELSETVRGTGGLGSTGTHHEVANS